MECNCTMRDEIIIHCTIHRTAPLVLAQLIKAHLLYTFGGTFCHECSTTYPDHVEGCTYELWGAAIKLAIADHPTLRKELGYD